MVAAINGQPTAIVDDVRRALTRFIELHRAGDTLRLEVVRRARRPS